MSVENIKNRFVNVNGVSFDISSILNDVTVSIQNNIQKSLDSALKDYDLYKSTYDAVLKIPFVRDLYLQNQDLIYQLEQSHSQPIKLNINEISPPQSPVIMHSHIPFDSSNYQIKSENKKLSSDTNIDEKSNSSLNMSDSTESSEESNYEETDSTVTTSESEQEEDDISESE